MFVRYLLFYTVKFIFMFDKSVYVCVIVTFVKLKSTAVGRSLGRLFSRSDTSHKKKGKLFVNETSKF